MHLRYHPRGWTVRFPYIWLRIALLKVRAMIGGWNNQQYLRAVFSIPEVDDSPLNDKFASVRARITSAVGRVDPTVPILDLGCGFAFQAWEFSRAGYHRVFAFDLVLDRVFTAKRIHGNGGPHLFGADMVRIPIRDQSIGAIAIGVALHDLHPYSIARVILECHRVLRPGGRLVVLEPRYLRDIAHVPAQLTYGLLVPIFDESRTLSSFMNLNLRNLTQRAGFELITQETVWHSLLALYVFSKLNKEACED